MEENYTRSSKRKNVVDDRAPTLEEIHKIIEYPDRRMKSIVYTMASSGIRVGAWDHLKWNHISPIVRDGKLLAAKINVYAGEDDEYTTFITPEADHMPKNEGIIHYCNNNNQIL
jgi:hypothetical protein